MEINSTFSSDFSSLSLFASLIITALCCFFALIADRSPPLPKSISVESDGGNSESMVAMATATATATHLNGGSGGGEIVERVQGVAAVAERQTGVLMVEQLVPEITTHALSYLDYQSLCRLSMTNSLMRKAANDDNAWKALYHKDFTFEQYSVTPVNGWKAYYAATSAIVFINAKFFNIIREISLPAMGHLWLNADYVKCVHASGEFFTGWQLAFNWEQGVDFQIQDVRVLTDMAWVTMKAYVDLETGPFNVTNGTWCIITAL